MIRLLYNFSWTETVDVIELSSEPWRHRGYRDCVMTAFGAVSAGEESADDFTRKTHKLEIKQHCVCAFAFHEFYEDPVASHFFCAKPRQDYGGCGGDSGGGLVCDGKVVAVNMHILEFCDINYCELNRAEIAFDENILEEVGVVTCAGKNTLTVFQAACPVLPWINAHVKLFSEDEIAECAALGSSGGAVRAQYWIIATGIVITFSVL